MTRHLFILSRRDPELYSYLKERFAGDAAVEVIVDRRHTESGPTPGSSGVDRRRRPDADAELLTRSYTIVTLAEMASVSSGFPAGVACYGSKRPPRLTSVRRRRP
jgi:hypothetical protein